MNETQLRRSVRTLDRRVRERFANGPQIALFLLAGDDTAGRAATIDSVLAQKNPCWQLFVCHRSAPEPGEIEARSDPRIRVINADDEARALNTALGAADAEFVAVLSPGERLRPDALSSLRPVLDEADVVYTDESTVEPERRSVWSAAKPHWSPEYALAYPYTGRLCLIRRSVAETIGGWREECLAAEDYDLVLQASAAGAAVKHVPRSVYERPLADADADRFGTPSAVRARRVALEAYLSATAKRAKIVDVDGPVRLRVRYEVDDSPLISIIIPTRDRLEFLRSCIESIESRSVYRSYEIVIVDNESRESDTREYLDSSPHCVIAHSGPFNFAAANNVGVAAARGDYLLFLNNDCELIAPESLSALLEWAQQPEIACVGAKLLFGDHRLQHVGVVLRDGSAHHHFYGQREEDAGWLNVDVVRNYSAVTAACLMMRRSVFEELGGFDESFPANYNDVDLCLRALQHGYRNVYTPYAVLYHHEHSSRPATVREEEHAYLRSRHGRLLWNDPYWPLTTDILRPPESRTSLERLLRRVVPRVRGASRSVRHLAGLVRGRYLSRFFVATPLYGLNTTGVVPQDDRVRWVDRVEVDGGTQHGLFMHPESSATFKTLVPPKPRFRAWLALMPEVWEKNEGGVTFSVCVRTHAGLEVAGEWTVDPSRYPADRRWVPAALNLGPFAGLDAQIVLSTRLPEGAGSAHAWAVWGNPELLTRKSIRALVRKLLPRGVSTRAGPAAGGPYSAWFARHSSSRSDLDALRTEASRLPYRPTISLITPVFNTEPHWLRRCIASVLDQAYENWELCLCDDGSTNRETLAALQGLEALDGRIIVERLPENSGISAASNIAFARSSGEFVGLLDHDDELTPDALYEVVKLLNVRPDADVIYTDEDKLDPDGTPAEPFFKPDWSPEYLRSTMYIGHLAVYRRELVEAIGGFRSAFDGAQDYDLALRVIERTSRILHIPRVAYHWRKAEGSAATSPESKPWGYEAGLRALEDHVRRLGLDAEACNEPGNGYWRVRYRVVDEPLVTVVIPTAGGAVDTSDGHRNILVNCLTSIAERTTYANYEVLLVDNGDLPPDVQAVLPQIPHRRATYSYKGDFNLAAKINFAVNQTQGEHLLLLNDDTEVITDDWIRAMLEFSQQPEIGAVGAKLYYPDGRVQHAGVVLGIGGGACHVYEGAPGTSPGYFGSANIVRNYSAVTGACMMTRRSVFDEVGGFDETFAIDFNDVDFCLRVGACGYRIVYTPFAQLYHYQGASVGNRIGFVNPREVKALSARWHDVIEDDPFYNPSLTRSAVDYSLRF